MNSRPMNLLMHESWSERKWQQPRVSEDSEEDKHLHAGLTQERQVKRVNI